MAIVWTRTEWHDLRIAPEDLPEPGEEVLVTTELLDETRRVQANVYLKELTNGNYCWCEKIFDTRRNCVEEAIVWYEVVAWAYYPPAYMVY